MRARCAGFDRSPVEVEARRLSGGQKTYPVCSARVGKRIILEWSGFRSLEHIGNVVTCRCQTFRCVRVSFGDFVSIVSAKMAENLAEILATPAGFEPATTRLEGECSIQLSYGVVASVLLRRRAQQRVSCECGRSGNCPHSSSASRCCRAAG